MRKTLKQIVAFAIRQEEHFYKLYSKGAKQTDVISARQLLVKLADQEKKHKERLKALDTKKAAETAFQKKLDSIRTEELMLTPLNEIKALKDIFSYAIRSEVNAKTMYAKLAASVSDKKAKQLFLALSKEEKKHEDLLKKEIKKLSL